MELELAVQIAMLIKTGVFWFGHIDWVPFNLQFLRMSGEGTLYTFQGDAFNRAGKK